jgi:nicotinamide riboside kinase
MEDSGKQITRFILTGPESTGKSVLTMGLAKHFSKSFIPEYARDYILNLKRAYNYNDVLHIAERQVEQINDFTLKCNDFLFVDTYLIITKIWFLKVFGEYPEWLDQEILKTKNDIYLICKPDIPWIPDGVRENGGERREVLYNEYLNELKKLDLHFSYIEGDWSIRMTNAIRVVEQIVTERKLV